MAIIVHDQRVAQAFGVEPRPRRGTAGCSGDVEDPIGAGADRPRGRGPASSAHAGREHGAAERGFAAGRRRLTGAGVFTSEVLDGEEDRETAAPAMLTIAEPM
jgi:hypothetical protein